MTRDEQIKNFANSQVDYEFFNENIYNGILIGAKWEQCIPYEGNEHLLGTANDCDDFYKY